jgi:hypothetical protein
MRALSYMIALVFVLTGPSMAGSADRDLPGGRHLHLLRNPDRDPGAEADGRDRPVNDCR